MSIVSVTEAIKRIDEYLCNTSAYPYFVVVDGSAEYNSILSRFSSIERIKVSNYCNDDSFADYDTLCDVIECGYGHRVLLGLGDCIALSGHTKVLGRIKDISLCGKMIVFCRGIRAHITKLYETDQKFNNRRYCEVKSSLDYTVISINPSVFFEAYSGFRRLLQELEYGKGGDFFVHTELPINSNRSISSSYEAVIEKMVGFQVAEASLSDEYWSEFNQDSNLNDYDLLHWRTYISMQLQPVKNIYLQMVMALSSSYDIYKLMLYDALLGVPIRQKDFWALYSARKALLKDLPGTEASRYVALTEQMDLDRIYYLTDNTAVERYAIIEEFSKIGSIPKELTTIYPALAKYLAEYTFTCKNTELFTPYFSKYKHHKLLNSISDDFREEVLELATDGNRAYTCLNTREFLVEKLNNGINELYWIDALGVEYLGYIQTMAKEMGLHIFVQVGRSVLPTLTCFNRDFYDGWKGNKVQTKKLDTIKHEGEQSFNYNSQKLPIHLAEELRIIDEALVWAKTELRQNRTNLVVITSDHGSSRLAVISNSENKWEMATKGLHSGRCCPKNEIDEKPGTATDEHGFWVLANYDRFKGGKKASVEVHGGASLEEVLVPVIQVSLLNGTIELKNMTEIAWSSWDEDPFIEIFSPAKIDALALRFNGRLYHSTTIGEKKYKVIFDDFIRSGTYVADVLDGDNLIGEITFRIEKRSGKSKSAEEDEFFK